LTYGWIGARKGDNFDYEKNLAHWKYNQGVIDINYLVVQINTKRDPSNRMQFIPKYKPFIPITADIKNKEVQHGSPLLI
jgi:hypothetical protein